MSVCRYRLRLILLDVSVQVMTQINFVKCQCAGKDFHFLWDHWAHCGIFENGVLLMFTLEDVSSVANFITAYEDSIKSRLPFSYL